MLGVYSGFSTNLDLTLAGFPIDPEAGITYMNNLSSGDAALGLPGYSLGPGLPLGGERVTAIAIFHDLFIGGSTTASGSMFSSIFFMSPGGSIVGGGGDTGGQAANTAYFAAGLAAARPTIACGAKAALNFAKDAGLDVLAATPGLGPVADGVVLVASAANMNWSDSTSVGFSFTEQFIGIASKPGNLAAIAKFSTRAAEAIPIFGYAVAGASVVYDGYSAYKDYQKCMAEAY